MSAHARFALSSLVLALLLSAAAAVAQDRTPRRTTPLDAARQMHAARTPAADAAVALRRTHRQSPHQIAGLLDRAGYATGAVTHALVAGLRTAPGDAATWMRQARHPAGQVASGLKRAGLADARVAGALRGGGFSVAETARAAVGDLRVEELQVGRVLVEGGYAVQQTREALRSTNINSDPEFVEPEACVTWDAQLMCPGGPGSGSTWGSAMGAVTVTPPDEGETGATVTMESTNIPEVEVRLGSVPLQLLEANSARVRAVLPSSPMTGDLVMVRQTDGVVGTIVSGYQVVAPAEEEPEYAWDDWSDAAREAAVNQVRQWLLYARIQSAHCVVNAGFATGTVGVLASGHDIAGGIRGGLQAAGAPNDIAAAWGRGFADAWHGWAYQVTIPGLLWYPAFIDWPGAQAPPTASPPTPLGSLTSAGLAFMAPAAIRQRVEDEIGGAAGSSAAEDAIQAFANDLGTRFGLYQASAQMHAVMGSGPVPSYDPDAGVPKGPVVGGTCEGGMLISATPF